jgi:hypothetical protein
MRLRKVVGKETRDKEIQKEKEKLIEFEQKAIQRITILHQKHKKCWNFDYDLKNEWDSFELETVLFGGFGVFKYGTPMLAFQKFYRHINTNKEQLHIKKIDYDYGGSLSSFLHRAKENMYIQFNDDHILRIKN